MAAFAIRVELRGDPSYAQYQILHGVMEGYGFYRTIQGQDTQGNLNDFNLPHATYYGFSESNVVAVRNAIVNAVKSQVQQNILVFVVEVGRWALGW